MANNDSIISPRDITLEELMDIKAIQDLCENFTRLTGIVTAILNLEGKILVASGWQELCTDFHRKHPQTFARCRESDTELASRLNLGQTYNVYLCKNGLVDVAVPIIIENTHIGNLFTGQFFFEPPDKEFFVQQAEEFGFDKTAYLAALEKVPILSKERVEHALEFLTSLTTVIANAGLDKKKLRDLNIHLEDRIVERALEIQLERNFSDSLIQSLPGIMYVLDKVGRFRRWNKNFETVSKYSADRIKELSPLDLFMSQADKERITRAIDLVFKEGQAQVEAEFTTKDGRRIPYLFTGYRFVQDDLEYLVGVGLDISDRVAAEQAKEVLITKLEDMLSQVKRLSGLLPICSACKKIRDDQGYWNQIEAYIREHSEVEFSHSLCPECARKLYPGLKIPGKRGPSE